VARAGGGGRAGVPWGAVAPRGRRPLRTGL